MDTTDAIQLIDRRSGTQVTEKVLGDRQLRQAYLGPGAGLLRPLLFRTGILTHLLGWFADSALSRGKIRRTIEELGIDMSECADPPASFRCFNDFFTRRLKPETRPFEPAATAVCSPADCRLQVCAPLTDNRCLPVKGTAFSVREFLGLSGPCPCCAGKPGTLHGDMFQGGTAFLLRLCPADYHRYHYPVDGELRRAWDISGRYDSVNPLALGLKIPVFTHNVRCVSILESGVCGIFGFVEVGAFGVSRIVPTHLQRVFRKGEEKGYFAFGGSTIVLLFEPGRITPDADLVANSARGLETLVRAGERIALATH